MTDYHKALAAARKRVQIINSLRPELLDDNEIAIRDLVAAIDAAQGEAVAWVDEFGNAYPLAAYNGKGDWLDDHKRHWRRAYAVPPAALAVLQDLSERFSAMHANGDVWITSVAAAKMAQAAATQAPPAAAVPEGGLRDSVLNSAKFRASCYALVGIVEGIAGLGRRWASDGERLKDTPEWVAFYNSVAAMRNGTFDPASAEQAPPAAVGVPTEDAALDAARGEAVWQYRATSQGQTWVDCRDEQIARTMKANGFEIRCLYAAPPAALAENVAADAYAHACDRMEEWQRKRAAEGKEIGTQGSLCDGIAWLYQRVEALEAKQPAALAVPAANVTPMRQPRADLARLVESINAAVYANGDGLSVTEAIGALELAKLELLKEQEQ